MVVISRLLCILGLIVAGICINAQETPEVKTLKPPILEYSFSEGAGNILKDKSGNGNNGVIHGAEWVKDSDGKYCLSFDGIDDYAEIAFTPTLSLGQEFSVEMFVKPGVNTKKEGTGDFRLLLGQSGDYWDPTSSFGICLIAPYNGVDAYFRYGASNIPTKNEVVDVGVNGLLTSNDWTKITYIKKLNFVTLYINSHPVRIINISDKNIIKSEKKFLIGGIPGRYFNGFIKDIKVYNYPIITAPTVAKANSSVKTKPYLLMVTSMDEQISSTPLIDIKKEIVERFNNSPFNGIALNMIDIYSAQKPADEKIILDKAAEFKSVTQKDIWPRINLNRIYQRTEKHVYNKENPCIEDVNGMPTQGVHVVTARKQSTYYFRKINLVDIYDEAGALSDFYQMWSLALKFSSAMKSGVFLDFENYNFIKKNNCATYEVASIAKKHNKPVDEVIRKLVEIGSHMGEIAEKEYPAVVIITAFLNLPTMHYIESKPYYNAFDYIAQGILMKAKEKKLPLVLLEGGESSVQYVNRTLTGLENNLITRQFYYTPWLERFPRNFKFAGTITVWDDVSKLSGWPKSNAGTPNPFQSLNDFAPFIKEIGKNCDYIWFYQPACTEYKPFSAEASKSTHDFHEKFNTVIEQTLKDNK